jgi:hypothetical protein
MPIARIDGAWDAEELAEVHYLIRVLTSDDFCIKNTEYDLTMCESVCR